MLRGNSCIPVIPEYCEASGGFHTRWASSFWFCCCRKFSFSIRKHYGESFAMFLLAPRSRWFPIGGNLGCNPDGSCKPVNFFPLSSKQRRAEIQYLSRCARRNLPSVHSASPQVAWYISTWTSAEYRYSTLRSMKELQFCCAKEAWWGQSEAPGTKHQVMHCPTPPGKRSTWKKWLPY